MPMPLFVSSCLVYVLLRLFQPPRLCLPRCEEDGKQPGPISLATKMQETRFKDSEKRQEVPADSVTW